MSPIWTSAGSTASIATSLRENITKAGNESTAGAEDIDFVIVSISDINIAGRIERACDSTFAVDYPIIVDTFRVVCRAARKIWIPAVKPINSRTADAGSGTAESAPDPLVANKLINA